VGWAHYLFEFSLWLPGGIDREQNQIPGGCLSLRRDAFARYGPFPDDVLSEDTAFCWRLATAGASMRFVPSVRVFHIHTERLWPLADWKMRHGADFARQRSGGLRPGLRYVFAAGTPLLPALLLLRIARRVVRSGHFGTQFLTAMPMIALLAGAWSCGELRGYLAGRLRPYPPVCASTVLRAPRRQPLRDQIVHDGIEDHPDVRG